MFKQQKLIRSTCLSAVSEAHGSLRAFGFTWRVMLTPYEPFIITKNSRGWHYASVLSSPPSPHPLLPSWVLMLHQNKPPVHIATEHFYIASAWERYATHWTITWSTLGNSRIFCWFLSKTPLIKRTIKREEDLLHTGQTWNIFWHQGCQGISAPIGSIFQIFPFSISLGIKLGSPKHLSQFVLNVIECKTILMGSAESGL